ncbi:MAG: acetoin utilization protein AcuC [Thermoleophilia bacterium]
MSRPLDLLVVHDDGLGMAFGGDHPTDARRHRLAVALCREAGLFDRPGVELRPAPGPLADEQLARVFAPAFIRAVRRYAAQPVLAAEPEARQWGIGGDNNAYPGMHHDSARASAACAAAAAAVASGEARRALVPAGGAHHGTASRASGFGIYNETAVAVRWLLDAGVERVAYVDVDVHHGDGTQWIFYDEPRVLTVSVHESGRHLFPGTGFPAETGGAAAPGTAANVALPPFAGDDAYRLAMREVVEPVVRAFAPGAIVTQCGVDHHHADPLSHMLTTMPLYPELWRALRDLADEECDGRWVALGGGGYDPCTAPPRAWAGLAHVMAGVPVPDRVPPSWSALAVAAGCPAPPAGWWDDPGPAPDADRDRRAGAEAEAAIARSVAALRRFWDRPAP